jgi:hypothetical protein
MGVHTSVLNAGSFKAYQKSTKQLRSISLLISLKLAFACVYYWNANHSVTDRPCWVCCRSLRTTAISHNFFWLYTLLTTFFISMVQGRGRSKLIFGSGALACTLLQNGGGLSAKVS